MAWLMYTSLNAQIKSVKYTFTLDSASTTSAGIFDNQNRLVRSLWNLKSLPAGVQSAEWDRLDDYGHLLTDTGYHLKVLANRVKYTWEGVVGNNSDSTSGSSKIRHFDRIRDMVIAGNWLYYAAGYSEGVPSCYKINTSQPNRKYNILFEGKEDVDQDAELVATDSQYVWWAGFDPFEPQNSFVYATKVGSDSEVLFSGGQSLKMFYGRTYPSVIALDTISANNQISGLAAQKNGKFLFVARQGKNQLQVYSKSDGNLVRTLSANYPGRLVIDSKDRLWMQCGRDTVCQLGFDTLGQIDSVYRRKKLPSVPLAFAVSQDDSFFSVLLGDTFQQVYAYSVKTDSLEWVLGQKGGYEVDNFVQEDKFYLSDDVNQLGETYICFDKNNGFWMGDVGNERALHFSRNRVLQEKIEYLPHSYSVAVNKTDSSRVFNEFLEYKIDYSKPLQAGNGSWRLYRNWRAGIDSGHYNPSGIGVLKNVVRYPNGKTYAFIDYVDSFKMRYPELVLMPDTGNFVFSGRRLDKFANDVIDRDGSRTWLVGGTEIGNKQYVLHAALNGYDTAGYPIWSAQDTVAYVPVINAYSPAYKGVAPLTKTGSGQYIFFNAGKFSSGYHLGAIQAEDSLYQWMTAASTFRSYRGAYPEDGVFDIGNGVEYPAATVNSVDKSIFWNYHGEFWKNSQTNRWQHVYDNGLYVGDFGVTTPDGLPGNYEAFAGGAGNALSSALVKLGSNYYIYHCDESVNGGVHRWKVSNLSSIKVYSVRSALPLVSSGKVKTEYFDGNYLDPVRMKSQSLDNAISRTQIGPAIADSNAMSSRISAYLEVNATGKYAFHARVRKGLRIWVDGHLIIDTFANSGANEFKSDSIDLVGGTVYPLRIEISDYLLNFYWSSNTFSKVSVSSAYLYATDTGSSDTVNLMSGWINNPKFKASYYGWQRSPANDFDVSFKNHWTVQTYAKSYFRDQPDIFMRFAKDTGVYYVQRPLPSPGNCPVSWDVEGEIDYDEDFNIFALTNNTRLEILDDSGGVIAYLEHEMINRGINFSTEIKGYDSAFVAQSGKYSNTYTNRFKAFKIHADSNGVDYTYGSYALKDMTGSAGNWKRPSTIRFKFESGTGTFGAALAVRNLIFYRHDSLQPPVYPEEALRICSGDTVELSTDSFAHYLWSNGDTVRKISVSSAGLYSVKVSDQYCKGISAGKSVGLKARPNPNITKNGLVLKSNYRYGNAWYFNNSPISGATDSVYTLSQAGTYSLLVTDTNGCSSMVDLLVPLQVTENVFKYGCQDGGILWVEHSPQIKGQLMYMEEGGGVWTPVTVNSLKIWIDGNVRYYSQVAFGTGRRFAFVYEDVNGNKHIEDLDLSACISRIVYNMVPNPYESTWQLILPAGLAINSSIKIEVYNLGSQLIYSTEPDRESKESGRVKIDGSEWAEGLYLVVVTENGVVRQRELLLHIRS